MSEEEVKDAVAMESEDINEDGENDEGGNEETEIEEEELPPPDFNNLFTQLEGTKVLVQPRVSRETILSVIKEHTSILQNLTTGFQEVKTIMKDLMKETKANQKHIEKTDATLAEAKNEIVDIQSTCATFREELNAINNTLTDVFTLKRDMRDQKNAHADLLGKFNAHTNMIDEFLKSTDTKLTAMDALNKETQFKLTELKDYVDHFGDNLILASSQITVESAIGFSSRPMALRDVLKQLNKFTEDTSETLTSHTTQIEENHNTVNTKADATIITDVNQINQRVMSIEAHLKKEEETGISAIRKMCDDLTVSVESIIADLAEKVDTRNVDNIVHKKYEDIVEYLQQALSSNAEDEANFNARAQTMQEDMKRMSAGKADRVEIQKMQESLVKTEAMLQKFSVQFKSSDMTKMKNMLTREQIDALLFLKVDKSQFESELHNIMKGVKRNKRNNMLGGIMTDDALPDMNSPETKLDPQPQNEMMDHRMAAHLVDDDMRREGNDNERPTSGAGTMSYPKTPPNFVPGHGQDLSVLGAATTGGGFNTKRKPGDGGMVGQGRVEPRDPSGGGPDVEGLGMMLEGSDGKMYYGDEMDERKALVEKIY